MEKGALRSRINAAVAYMEQHMHDKITRDQLAALAGLNPEHFSRVFKKLTGSSPVDYLTGLRVARARHLLRRSPLPIKEIARRVGVEDPYYFSRMFKRQTGTAPSDHKRESFPRVVALEYYGHLRALEMEPVAINAQVDGMQGELSDWSAYTLDIGMPDAGDCEAERIKRHRPDLIVTHSHDHARRLSAFGRVCVVEEEKDPIYGQLPALGRALGRDAEAARWLEAYERRLNGLRARAAAYFRQETVALVRIRAEVMQVYGNMIMGYPLYKALQLKPPRKLSKQFVINACYHSTVIEPEELHYYEADHLFVVVQPDEETGALWERIRRSRSWLRYPAVAQGRVYELDVRRWLAYDPVSILRQAEEVAELADRRIALAKTHNNPS